MVALRARLGTHECVCEALLELTLGTTKLCLTLLFLLIILLNALCNPTPG